MKAHTRTFKGCLGLEMPKIRGGKITISDSQALQKYARNAIKAKSELTKTNHKNLRITNIYNLRTYFKFQFLKNRPENKTIKKGM